MVSSRRSVFRALAFALVSGVAGLSLAGAVLPGCRSGGGNKVSSDPSANTYRSPTADLSQVKNVRVNFVSVKTNNNEGGDLVKQVFMDSLKTHLGRSFPDVAEGTAALPGGALLDVNVEVNWGSRAARAFAGLGAGRAGIIIKYDLNDANRALLAKLHTQDTMSSGAWGGDARALVFAAAEKWSQYFQQHVLAAPPAAAAAAR
jgi:hypothetical protein